MTLSACASRDQSGHAATAPDNTPIGTGYVTNVLLPGGQTANGDTGRGSRSARENTGVNGVNSVAGSVGPQGAAGKPGEQGAKGDTGAKGERGERGEKGDRGDSGSKGERGDRGEKGDRGETGDRGEPGPPGRDGLQGPAGVSLVSLLYPQGKSADGNNNPKPDGGSGSPPENLLTSLAKLVTALTPIVLALLEIWKRNLSAGRPPTLRESREYAESKISHSPDLSEFDREKLIAALTRQDFNRRRALYRARRNRTREQSNIARVLQLLIVCCGLVGIVYLGYELLVSLLIFICAYTLILSVALLCCALAKKLLDEKSHKKNLLEFRVRLMEMKYAHELNMSRQRFDEQMKLLQEGNARRDRSNKFEL